MCDCSVNLASRSGSPLRSGELPFEDSPEGVIRFILDNNEDGVRLNMNTDGIPTSMLTKSELRRWLVNSYNMGYDVSRYIIVPYNNDADNYTGGMVEKYGMDVPEGRESSVWTDYVIPFVAGGLGALGGTAVMNSTGLNQAPPPPQTPTIPVWVWVIAGVLVLVLVVVLIKRN